MKVSVSLPREDVALLDEYARSSGLPSRSAAVQRAIGLLRSRGLEEEYAAAWTEWDRSGDREQWEQASSDGLTDAPR